MVHLPTALFSLSYIRDSSNRCSHYAPLRGATVVTRTVTEGAAEFQSTRPMRGATPMAIHRSLPMPFQSTRPARGATCPHGQYGRGTFYFNPRAAIRIRSRRRWYFNPRAPRGARPTLRRCWEGRTVFQATRPARGATFRHKGCPAIFRISIHAPREGRDHVRQSSLKAAEEFQSTRPARGATTGAVRPLAAPWYFNPRAPCGARPLQSGSVARS